MGVILWLLPSNESTCYIALSLRLFIPNSLPAYHHFFLSQGLFIWHLWPVSPSFLWLGFHGNFSQSALAAPSLKPLIPSSSHVGCQSVHVYQHHLPPPGAAKSSKSGECSYIYSSYSVCHLFFCFGGGRPLHNVQLLIFHNLMEVWTVCFAISSSMVFLKILPNVLSFLRHSCSFNSQSLILLMHSGCAKHLFLSLHPFKVSLATLSLSGPWRPCCLCDAGMAQQVIPLWTVANSVRDPPSLCIHFCSYRGCPMARFRFPHHFFSALTVFTAASSLGTFSCTAMDSYLIWGWLLTLQTGHHLF
jgi:hypothetical protein